MDKMKVRGGATLSGTVSISGAKNSALPLIFSTLLAPGTHRLSNVPKLRDIDSSMELMNSLGCRCEFNNGTLIIEGSDELETLAHYDQVRKMRASILVLGPLLARFKKAKVSLPGGCAIGARPIGMHLDALEQLGAKIEMEEGYVVASTEGLKGTTIEFPFPTVGGTENIMMAASLAKGKTILKNVAREPEIVDLANYLSTMGVEISGAGTSTIEIVGQKTLSAGEHAVIPDRIEAGTFVVAGALAGNEVTLTNCEPSHLESFLEAVQEMGVRLETSERQIKVYGCKKLKPITIETEPFPGYPTDLQAQLMVLMTQAEGQSKVIEKVFENRFMHVPELVRMGAKITIKGQEAEIDGPAALLAAPVMATDLRASACLIVAALVAKGETTVNRIYHLDRGYEKLEDKLSQLGANIERVKD